MNVSIMRGLDRLVGLKVWALGLFPRRKVVASPKRILCIQLWGIGETVLTLPAIHALAKANPKAKIEILATRRNADVYFGQGFETHIISPQPFSVISFVTTHHYDLVVDFEEYLNTSALVARLCGSSAVGFSTGIRRKAYTITVPYDDKQHTAETFMDLIRALGVKHGKVKLLPLRITKEEGKAGEKFLREHGIRHFVGMAPGVAESGRQRMWPLERFATVADSLGPPVVFFGSSKERKMIEDVQGMMKKTSYRFDGSLREAFALISKTSLFISNDSGLMHVAAAQGNKVLALFGPNLPVRWRPLNDKSVALYGEYWCSPCINSHLGKFPGCIYGSDNRCIKGVSEHQVVDAAKKMIS